MESGLVHIVGGGYSVDTLFREHGFATSTGWEPNYETVDAYVFTGGEDINPALYGEKPLTSTSFNNLRDKHEIDIYNKIPKDKPKFGICRGGQLLNVLSGGSMWQHVNHHQGSHPMKDIRTGKIISTSSLHHQMMIPGDDCDIIAVANQSDLYMGYKQTIERRSTAINGHWQDVEVLWYPRTKSLCFQGHPEFGNKECTAYFFQLIKELA